MQPVDSGRDTLCRIEERSDARTLPHPTIRSTGFNASGPNNINS